MTRRPLLAASLALGLLAASACGEGTAVIGVDDRFDGQRVESPTWLSLLGPQKLALRRLMLDSGVRWDVHLEDGGRIFLAGRGPAPLRSAISMDLAAIEFLQTYAGLFGIADAAAELRPTRTEQDRQGFTHVRLQQVVSGVPVWGGDLAVQLDGAGRVVSLNGRYVKDVLHLARPARLPALFATGVARDSVLAARPGLAPRFLATLAVEPLIYAEGDAPRLAWLVTLRVEDGRSPAKPRVFVDADGGEILFSYDDLQTVAGSGVGVHGDTKTFDVTNGGGQYELRSNAVNPNGILTYDAAQQQIQPGSIMTSGSPNSWDTGVYGAGSGVDAYAYQGSTYLYYKNVQARNGIDGNNLAQVSTIHYGQGFDNAFWDGNQMVFGDGDGTNFIAFGAGLDVIAHELTHGVTQNTSNLQYVNQSGALNEANSDIMGTFVELSAYGNPAFGKAGNWLMGEDIMAPGSPLGNALRDFANPKAHQQPDHMSQYVNTGADNGGVHTNSGIINNAAYLMSEGGTNSTSGQAVSGIGRAKAEQIYFYASSNCYTSSTQFTAAANCNLQAAQALYGNPSAEYVATRSAFEAVGVLTVCTPQCSGIPCGAPNGCGGTCAAGSGCTVCTPACAGKLCGAADGCGGTCAAGSGCCAPACSGKLCGAADGCGGTCAAGSGCCTPACTGKSCGAADGCGGTCAAGSGCCTPVCSGKTCGSANGCGGTCAAGSGCCTPVCAGKVCGNGDGCGGSCVAGSGCTPGCTPQCSGHACGDSDGCGGTCAAGSGCTCTPACSGKVCGTADGCGGTCAAGSGCNCTPACSGKTCGSSDGCGATCQPGSGCTGGCTPQCNGFYCGTSDGCGGTCQPGSGCKPLCTPACTGVLCGAGDGCGGTCGAGSGCTSCTPACSGKSCGAADGCGALCSPGSGCTPSTTDTVAPLVTLVDPADGASLAADKPVTVSARATDNVGVVKAILFWNGDPWSCDAPRAGVTCTHSGDSFAWTFVPTNSVHTFKVQAFDAAGNKGEAGPRSITVGPVGGGLSIKIVQPDADARFHPGDSVTVTVEVTGSAAATEVVLSWSSPYGKKSYAMKQELGGRWSVHGVLGDPGARSFRVGAIDALGHNAQADSRGVEVTP